MVNLPSYDSFLAEEHRSIIDQIERLSREIRSEVSGLSKEAEEIKNTNESAISLALAVPSIFHLSGLFLEWLGSKHSSSNLVVSVGRALDRYGSKLQLSIYELIKRAIKPLIYNLKPSDQDAIAKCLFASILAVKIATEFPTIATMDAFSTLVGKVEAAITAIEGKEIVNSIKEIMPKLASLVQVQ